MIKNWRIYKKDPTHGPDESTQSQIVLLGIFAIFLSVTSSTTEVAESKKSGFLHFQKTMKLHIFQDPGGRMRKGPYPLDLRKQLKVRVNNETFEKLAQLSEEDQKTKSSILRGFIAENLTKKH